MIFSFRAIALLEGVSYIILLFIAVPLKYLGDDEQYVKLFGMPHGLLFVAYILMAFVLQFSNYFSSHKQKKWSHITFVIIILAALIPFGTFYIDKKYLRS